MPPLFQLVPADAGVIRDLVLPAGAGARRQTAITWVLDQGQAQRCGLVLWNRAQVRFQDVWSLFDEHRYTRLGGCYRMEVADLTGDGHLDLLTRKDLDGSGGCGAYRILDTSRDRVSVLFTRGLCDGAIRVAGRTLIADRSVHRSDCNVHGCPGLHRVSRLVWDGTRFTETSNRVLRGHWHD